MERKIEVTQRYRNMVIFKRLAQDDSEITYEYYPEGKKENTPGIIVIDITRMQVKEIIPSGDDICIKQTVDELNEFRNNVNQMRIEEGEPEITEEEWPSAKEDVEYFQYAQHAIERIDEMYELNGVFPAEGNAVWY